MPTVRLSLACTGMPGSVAGATLAVSTTECFNYNAINDPVRPVRIFDIDRATAAANSLTEVIWDVEDMPTNGQAIDLRSATRRHVRNNMKRLKSFLNLTDAVLPACAQYVYRAFPASLFYASTYTAAQTLKWQAANEFIRDNVGSNNVSPSTDLYIFGQMATWSQAQMNAAVDANILEMRRVYPTGRLLVFLCAENHPGGTSPWAAVNNTRWGWLNTRLATYSYVDPVLWGGIANGPPNVPNYTNQTWAGYSASANYATFKAAWGMP